MPHRFLFKRGNIVKNCHTSYWFLLWNELKTWLQYIKKLFNKFRWLFLSILNDIVCQIHERQSTRWLCYINKSNFSPILSYGNHLTNLFSILSSIFVQSFDNASYDESAIKITFEWIVVKSSSRLTFFPMLVEWSLTLLWWMRFFIFELNYIKLKFVNTINKCTKCYERNEVICLNIYSRCVWYCVCLCVCAKYINWTEPNMLQVLHDICEWTIPCLLFHCFGSIDSSQIAYRISCIILGSGFLLERIDFLPVFSSKIARYKMLNLTVNRTINL